MRLLMVGVTLVVAAAPALGAARPIARGDACAWGAWTACAVSGATGGTMLHQLAPFRSAATTIAGATDRLSRSESPIDVRPIARAPQTARTQPPVERERRPVAERRPPAVLFVIPLAMLGILVLLYFLPPIIAAVRGHENTVAIFVLTLLAGWTFIGWVGALVWSVTAIRRNGREGNAA